MVQDVRSGEQQKCRLVFVTVPSDCFVRNTLLASAKEESAEFANGWPHLGRNKHSPSQAQPALLMSSHRFTITTRRFSFRDNYISVRSKPGWLLLC